jgi:molybdopterin synthase catalytic subunit
MAGNRTYTMIKPDAFESGNSGAILKIIEEATQKFELHRAIAVHRSGHLKIGETAVWVGTTASHRHTAFKATEYVIDQIKIRLPIWKKEYYVNELAQWVYCQHH